MSLHNIYTDTNNRELFCHSLNVELINGLIPSSGTTGATGPAGAGVSSENYLFAILDDEQTLFEAFVVLDFGTNVELDGWVNSSPGVYTCSQTGLYDISYTARVGHIETFLLATSDGVGVIGYKNATEILGSYSSIDHLSEAPNIITNRFLVNFDAADTFSLEIGASANGIYRLVNDGPGAAAVKPSATVTIIRVA